MKAGLALTLCTTFLAGCSTLPKVSQEEDSKRTRIYTSDLIINSENAVRYYSKKSENEGVLDFFKNIRAKREECYIFGEDTNEWIEVGYNEYSNSQRDGLFVNREVILEVASRNKKISLWHNHPHDGRKPVGWSDVLPSRVDLLWLIDFNSYLKTQGLDVKTKGGVVSRWGEMTYILNVPSKYSYEHAGKTLESFWYDSRDAFLPIELSILKWDLEKSNPQGKEHFKREFLDGEMTLEFKPIQ